MLSIEVVPRERPAPAAPQLGELLALLKVIADENRLQIFALLTRAELCVCELEDALGLSQSLVSNHLRVLKRAGLVRARRDALDARWIYYSVDEQVVDSLRLSLLRLLDLSLTDHSQVRCGPDRERRLP